MAFDFSTLVTDRTAADVTARNAKGTYNAADLNRVSTAVLDIAGQFSTLGYAVPVTARTDWAEADIPTTSQMEVYRQNIATLRRQIAVMQSTPKTPETMRFLDYVKANDIERILLDLDTLLDKLMKSWYFSGELYAGEV